MFPPNLEKLGMGTDPNAIFIELLKNALELSSPVSKLTSEEVNKLIVRLQAEGKSAEAAGVIAASATVICLMIAAAVAMTAVGLPKTFMANFFRDFINNPIITDLIDGTTIHNQKNAN